MKLGYSKLAMEEVPVPTAIRRIADIGYDGIELDVDSCIKTGWIARLLKDHNLRLASIGAYIEVGNDAYSRNVRQFKKGLISQRHWLRMMDLRLLMLDLLEYLVWGSTSKPKWNRIYGNQRNIFSRSISVR